MSSPYQLQKKVKRNMHKGKLFLLSNFTVALTFTFLAFDHSPKEKLVNASPAYSYPSNLSPINEPKYAGTTTITNVGTFTQKGTTYDRINVESTWSSYRGENVKVAIIDTGCNLNHDEFTNAIITKTYNVATGGTDVTDTSGHGTDTAACVAASINNTGGTGIAPNVELYIVKAVDANNTFPNNYLEAALKYCLKEHVDIINMSIQGYVTTFSYSFVEDMYGTTSTGTIQASSLYKSVLQDEIDACYNAGITIVAAAGNYNTNNVAYPAANDHVISVGSTGLDLTNGTAKDKLKAGFSNYGDWVDVVAPGYVIVPGSGSNTGYCLNSGTSFSSPIVAGAIALYKSKYPSATPDDIEQRLIQTCSSVNFSGSGAGQIDVEEFMDNGSGESWVSVTGISLSNRKISLNQQIQLEPTFSPLNATVQTCYWESSNTSIATVDSNGVVTGKALGLTTITATSIDGGFSSSCTLTVGDVVPVEGISISPKSLTLGVGEHFTLNAQLEPSNATDQLYMFDSSDENIATVDLETGEIEAVSSGTCEITVHSDEDWDIFDTCSITVTSSVVSEYYSGITATDSAGLSAQLHNLMFSTHDWYSSYNDCRNENGAYYAMDPGTNSSYLTDFYTQNNIDKSWAGSGDFTGHWNREHVWCQSKSAGLWDDTSGSTRGGGADYHHIRPIEMTLNSTRGNNTFNEIANRESHKVYSKTTSKTQAYLGGYLANGEFEPIDSIKGDIARILMYVYIHYSSNAGGTTPSSYSSYVGNLKLNDIICAGNSEANSKALLLKWHNQDIVSESERIRNEAAYGYQGNRNPFIDHPEYAETIFGTGKTLSSISITTSTHRTFDFGATFVGETVMANYSDDSSANVTSSATFSGYNMNQAGTQIVNVSYGGKSTTYSITVGQPQVTNLTLNKYTASLDVFSSPKTTTITATVTAQTGADKTVSWSIINNDGVVSLSASTGSTISVTALKAGTATVRATAGSISKDCVFTVTDSTPTYVTSILVSGTDELTVGGNTTLTATVSPDDATTKTVTWASSDTSVATITSGGKVTAVAPGTTNITATAKDGSGVVSNTFVITVKAKVTVTGMSFVDLPEELDFGSYDGMYHVKVQKDFSDGTHELIESGFGAQSKLEIDTTKLGTATVKATYTGLTTLNATVKVTNHNSSQESHTVEGGEVTTTITNKTFYNNGNTVINGETFVLDSDTSYFNYAERGQQIGSSGDPITKATIVKRNQMRVTKVVVNASGGSGTNAVIKVKVGSIYFTVNSAASASAAQAYAADAETSASLTSTASNYEFIGDATGDIAIEYEQSSSTAIFFKSLSVKTETTTIDSFTGVEQAEAWANYFIERTRGTNGPCLLSNETSKVNGLKALWDDVKYEYENMTGDGKDAFCDPTTSTLIRDCLVHYQFIVSSYGSKGSLTDFVKDSENVSPQVVSNANRIINEVFNDSSIMIALISVVGIAAIGVFIIYKKRKEN